MTPKQFKYDELRSWEDLTAQDLREEAAGYSGPRQAFTIGIFRANGIGTEAEQAQALYLPDEGRLGIAWSGNATWADVQDVESGIEMWLNDPDAWNAAN